MRLIYILILLSAFSFQFSANFAEAAQPVSLKELLENAEIYDGQTVLYQGEAIGDVMIRGDNAWVNVRDHFGALGVFAAREEVGAIAHLGGYKFSGDVISARGIFNHVCSAHGGDMDIHAQSITVVQKGEEIPHPLGIKKVQLAMILPTIAFALAMIYLIIKRFR